MREFAFFSLIREDFPLLGEEGLSTLISGEKAENPQWLPFEVFTFQIRKQLNHVTLIAETSWKFRRGIISCNCILLEKNKETVTVMQMNLKDPWQL